MQQGQVPSRVPAFQIYVFRPELAIGQRAPFCPGGSGGVTDNEWASLPSLVTFPRPLSAPWDCTGHLKSPCLSPQRSKHEGLNFHFSFIYVFGTDRAVPGSKKSHRTLSQLDSSKTVLNFIDLSFERRKQALLLNKTRGGGWTAEGHC